MVEKSLVTLYSNRSEMDAAVHRLDATGFPADHLSIIAQSEAVEPVGPVSLLTRIVLGAWIGCVIAVILVILVYALPGVHAYLLRQLALAGLAGCVIGALTAWLFRGGFRLRVASESTPSFLLVAHGSDEQIDLARQTLKTSAGHSQLYTTTADSSPSA